MCDVDGVVATMNRFEWLLEGNRFSGWSKFIKRYPEATLISRGARLVDDAVDAGFQVAWSTTRPDHAAADTWQWLLATPVQFILGGRFFRAGWAALKAGSATKDGEKIVSSEEV